MSLLVVTAFHSGDAKAALRLWNWIETLGKIDNDVLLVCEPLEDRLEQNRVLLAAKRAAKSVTRIFTDGKHENKWPQGPNAAFLAAAKYASEKRRNFLWLEADCVPIKQGWIREIETEYAQCGKQYLGGIVDCHPPLPKQVMYGVAVYRHTVLSIASQAIAERPDIAFDVSMSPSTVPLAAKSKLLQLVKPDTKPDIAEGVVLYHSDKNGDVIDRVKHPSYLNDITVVITTHNRIQKARRALDSCISARFGSIVITTTGYTKEDKDVITSWASDLVRVVHNETDNSNASWLNGVSLASTKFVHLLHDDDMVLPNFVDALVGTKHPFVYFPGVFHREIDPPDTLCSSPILWDGETKCEEMLAELSKNGTLAITPVRGIFLKDDLVEWLSEAGNVLPESCYLRPGFLVGNDLWIWLRASSKYDSFYAHASPVISLGCDSDSTTVIDGKEMENGNSRLLKIYDTTRAVFNKERAKKITVSPVSRLHILTIVLDGAPWLLGQLQTFNRLKLDWEWSIVEGTALPTHCTSWCKPIKTRLSNDGTSQILSDFSFHPRINVLSRQSWDGKLEMVNTPLLSRKSQEILLEVDVDEFWTANQIEDIVKMFNESPKESHAMFWCRYFVGPSKVITDHNVYANNPNQEWRRAWRFSPGQLFTSHEPPKMTGDQIKFFDHEYTAKRGLVFDHYSYVLRSQAAFKEEYYGYVGAVEKWKALQNEKRDVRLSEHFPWAVNSGIVKST